MNVLFGDQLRRRSWSGRLEETAIEASVNAAMSRWVAELRRRLSERPLIPVLH